MAKKTTKAKKLSAQDAKKRREERNKAKKLWAELYQGFDRQMGR